MINEINATLVEKKVLAKNILFLKYKVNNLESFKFEAGQYAIFKIKTSENTVVSRLYSIASAPDKLQTLEFIIETVEKGVGSAYFENLKINEVSKIQGPAGLFRFKSLKKDVFFIATGTGIAPIISIIKDQLSTENKNALTLLWGLKTTKDTYLIKELEALSKKFSNFNFKICLSQEQAKSGDIFFNGHVDDFLFSTISENKLQISDFDYYICGGKKVVESVHLKLKNEGVPLNQIFFERFS